jgi:Protein of unknown function (DUF1579)
MKRLSTLIVFLTLLFAMTIPTQAQMEMPKPGPELKKLDMFAGSWTLEGDMKPGPMGPGGKMTETEHCKWMDGGFFLVCHADFKSSMGNGTETAYMGYDTNDKVYTYDSFNSMGESDHSKGKVEGDTWTWSSDSKMGGQSIKGHFIMKVSSPASYSFKFEMSQDGTTWTTAMDGKATKQK